MDAGLTLKNKLHNGTDTLTCHICTIPSAAITQAIASAGADSVCIDMEHGAVDFGSLHAMIAATQGTGCAPIVRVSQIDTVEVKRVLDMGAEGVAFPLVRTADDARRAVASLRYPPNGTRGFGPFLAHSRWGVDLMSYRGAVDGNLVCILLVETKDAVENIEEICAVEGIDLIIPAQFDLSTDLGISGQFDHPDFLAAIERVEAAANTAGIPLGNVGLAEPQAKALISRGYRVICGFDAIWLKAKAAEAQAWARG